MIIGLSGKLSAGKTTAALHLCGHYGFRKIAFADALKQACQAVFAFSDEQIYTTKKEEVDPYWGISPRKALQIIGTDLFRDHFDTEIWVKAAMRRIDAEPSLDWVVDDLRFPNEMEAVLSRGGRVIRIQRPGHERHNGASSHSSETSLDGWAGWSDTIVNDGTIEDLQHRIGLSVVGQSFVASILNKATATG